MLEWLDAHHGHHPVEDVVAGTGLAKATTYHVLNQLRAAELEAAAEAGAGRMLYEAMQVPHHHFVCDDCGAVIDVACQEPGAPCVAAEVPGAEVRHADVVLRGRCATCRGARPEDAAVS